MESGADRDQALEWVLDKLAAKAKSPKAPAAPKIELPKAKPADKKKDLTAKKQNEIELWKTWKQSNHDPKHLDPLLKSLQPFINSYSNKYKGRVEIPPAAIDAEHKALAYQALKTFDPKKGVNLTTWVGTNLQKAWRFVNKTQNFARIAEPVSRHIGTYKAVKADLTNRLGHEPDDITLHEELQKIDPRIHMGVIKRLNKEIRKGLIATDALETTSDVTKDDRHKEVVHLIYHQLSPQERLVHEYTFGLNGKPELTTGAIAKKLKWDASKVSKLKTSIANKMKPHLE
jgi:DNA-directed RNA polymerase specialized sigma subunit